MRPLQPEWHCDPEKNMLIVSATVNDKPYRIGVQVKHSVQHDIERVTKYLKELVNEVIDEPTDQPSHVSVVS